MNNIVIVNQSGSKYLFSVPENVTLKEGDKVKCDTRKGVTDGICFTDSAVINTSALPLIAKLTGATLPLKRVVGKVVTSVETFEVQSDTRPCATPPITQQNEPKQEVVKLYCVKDYTNVFRTHALTKGKVYEFDGCCVNYDGIKCAHFNNLADWKRGDSDYAACLIPLVSRKAEVGEWVLITNILCSSNFHNEETYKVICVTASGNAMIETNTHATVLLPCEYLVLDNYSPEPEKVGPTYYSGKVVCVDNGGCPSFYTVGKIYKFVDGQMTNDEGMRSNSGHKCENFAELETNFSAKFIEYRGEQENT